MRTNRILLSLAMAVFVLLAVTPGVAQGPYYPVGSVSIDMTSVAAGVGASWGSGVLRFKGKRHLFKIDGLSVGSVGVSSINAVGNVYNMTSISQFAGNYAAVGAGVTLAGRRGRAEDAEPERRRHQFVCRAARRAVEHRAPGLHHQRLEIGKLPAGMVLGPAPLAGRPKTASSNLTRLQAWTWSG